MNSVNLYCVYDELAGYTTMIFEQPNDACARRACLPLLKDDLDFSEISLRFLGCFDRSKPELIPVSDPFAARVCYLSEIKKDVTHE